MTCRLPNNIPASLYTAAQCRDIDRAVIDSQAASGYELMTRAGQFLFDCMNAEFTRVKRVVILCGSGNNGGDGYVVAAIARQCGLEVVTFATSEPATQDARHAREFARQQQCDIIELTTAEDCQGELASADLIVDALLGTGVDRPLSGLFANLVDAINAALVPVVSCDLPTGLNSDTGCVMGRCVNAVLTVTFIALKAGMFSAEGKQHCGAIRFSDLDIDLKHYQAHTPVARLLSGRAFKPVLRHRGENEHKGTTGYVGVIGGAPGMSGAVLMAGKAAYRVGAGRVKVITHEQHAPQLALNCPELMTQAGAADLPPQQFEVIALGPGLGLSDWARALYNQALQAHCPIVIDADALNLLAREKCQRPNWVLTPHPGEAARLLGCNSADIQNDRFAAVRALNKQFGGVCVLKGSGTLIGAQNRTIRVCAAGNAGQATAGMGDVLSGCIAGLIAQGYELFDAACLGVWLHAVAADRQALKHGKLGMMASDLLSAIQRVHNQLHAGEVRDY